MAQGWMGGWGRRKQRPVCQGAPSVPPFSASEGLWGMCLPKPVLQTDCVALCAEARTASCSCLDCSSPESMTMSQLALALAATSAMLPP